MRKLFLLLTAVSGVFAAGAAVDYPYMVIRQKDGTEKSVSSEGLRFAVADGQLLVTSAEGSTSFKLSDLASMVFSTEAATVGDIETDFQTGTVEIFTVEGTHIGTLKPGQKPDNVIPETGVYILKSKNGSEKVLITK